MPDLNTLSGTSCGVVWFDPTVPATEKCYGWHRCTFAHGHEGDHECRGMCGSTASRPETPGSTR